MRKNFLKMNLQTFAENPDDDSQKLEIEVKETEPKPGGLSESVAASVAAAQAALESSMQKAQGLQMEAMKIAIDEFKTATEKCETLCNQMEGLLSQTEDLKAEALELVEALTPPSGKDDGNREDEDGLQRSQVEKPGHVQLLKKILL